MIINLKKNNIINLIYKQNMAHQHKNIRTIDDYYFDRTKYGINIREKWQNCTDFYGILSRIFSNFCSRFVSEISQWRCNLQFALV